MSKLKAAIRGALLGAAAFGCVCVFALILHWTLEAFGMLGYVAFLMIFMGAVIGVICE